MKLCKSYQPRDYTSPFHLISQPQHPPLGNLPIPPSNLLLDLETHPTLKLNHFPIDHDSPPMHLKLSLWLQLFITTLYYIGGTEAGYDHHTFSERTIFTAGRNFTAPGVLYARSVVLADGSLLASKLFFEFFVETWKFLCMLFGFNF